MKKIYIIPTTTATELKTQGLMEPSITVITPEEGDVEDVKEEKNFGVTYSIWDNEW